MENNGLFQLCYDERNRLDRVTVGALTTTYGVNGLGERVAKDGPPSSGKVEFVFDLSGGLLGQYNASGAAAEEIVWLGGLPVGTIQGGAAYHIAADHLGAPHQIVNSANVSVWFWDHEPFGDGWPASGFTHRLRFPGQIYDLESNLHSNGHRDYDPRLGRYVESDPIGLAGGINTYAYAGNDPVNAIDPLGLDPKSNERQQYAQVIDVEKIWRDISDNPWGSIQAGLDGLGPVGAIGGGTLRILGRVGAAARSLANQNAFYKAAIQPFKNSQLSNAGRALTKHPEVVGETKDTLRQFLRSDDAVNDAAHAALKDIMRNGVTSTPTLGRYGTVTQVQIPGGFGARWASDGSFIGFINP